MISIFIAVILLIMLILGLSAKYVNRVMPKLTVFAGLEKIFS